MGLLKRIASMLGLGRDDAPETSDETDGPVRVHADGRRRTKGFSVKVPVTVDRAPSAPLIAACRSGDGGVQGLEWYAKRSRIDEDGDVGDEFLDEVYPESSALAEGRSFPKFAVKQNARRVVIRNQTISEGKVHQHVEFRGKLLWV